MKLIILHDKPLVIDVPEDCGILDLKNRIHKDIGVIPEKQFLQFSGKNLNDNLTTNNYMIENNSIIFLNTSLDGGYVAGFPNVGHLIILLSVSTVFLFFCYYFFSKMLESFNVILNQKDCPPLPTRTATPVQTRPTTPIRSGKQTGGQRDYNFLYQISSMFYSSLFVVIVTIYGYTLFCNKNLSDWLLVITLASFIVIFLVLYIMYQLIKRKDLSMERVPFVGTMTFAIAGSIILALTFIIPSITETDYLHWTTYLYPIGVTVGTFLAHRYSEHIMNMRFVLLSILMVVVLVFIPYIVAYVYNTTKLCKN